MQNLKKFLKYIDKDFFECYTKSSKRKKIIEGTSRVVEGLAL